MPYFPSFRAIKVMQDSLNPKPIFIINRRIINFFCEAKELESRFEDGKLAARASFLVTVWGLRLGSFRKLGV